MLLLALAAAAAGVPGCDRRDAPAAVGPPAFAAASGAVPADRIVVRKARRTLTLYRDGRELRTYAVALGPGEPAPKRREGDNRTPEGLYRIDGRNPRSAYHRSLHISYPSPADTSAARARGERPGGGIMIHGLRNGFGWLGAAHRSVDWTAGCIAVTNEEIEEIWRLVPDGTAIEILP
ncbi:L,D-transpeptidase family protein [Azospirillum sp. A39]|uniref:L,D-transpeptidase family protein n=1 Tax=Azospirillum sp. A39 TaxID=3462279 RepID=UPI0040458955